MEYTPMVQKQNPEKESAFLFSLSILVTIPKLGNNPSVKKKY